MWCNKCQQDVPGVAPPEGDGKICCARCGGGLASGAALVSQPIEQHTASDEASSPDKTNLETSDHSDDLDSSQPPVDLDDWEFEEDLQAVDRLLRSLRSSGLLDNSNSHGEKLAAHTAHAAVPHWHLSTPTSDTGMPRAVPSTPSTNTKPVRQSGFLSFAAWTLLLLGLMTFVCGAVLVGWSFVESRPELWRIGLPLTLVGQAVLLVGLLFQLEGLWQSSQDTTTTLDELDEQLHDLRHTSSLISSSHSTAAQSFYAHIAEGARPEVLLTDLKGQLDMLAVKIANERR